MDEIAAVKLSPELRTRLAYLLNGAVDYLEGLEQGVSLAEKLDIGLVLCDVEPRSSLVRFPSIQKLHASQSFHNLVDFVWTQPSLFAAIIDSSKSGLTPAEIDHPRLRLYVEIILIGLVATVKHGALTRKREELINEFLSFLDLRKVNRLVVVPLMHVKTTAKQYTIAGFGVLQGDHHEHACNPETNLSYVTPLASLQFTIETYHFVAASVFPVSEEIRSRIALLRLIVHPLIAYNHFYVEHIRPWEQPLDETRFWGRFWSSEKAKLNVPYCTFLDAHVAGIQDLQPKVECMKWNQLTPWRLGIDRLDDAVFKLHYGSPDSILDLVIGLEAIFVDSDSRQESTHKVALRAARFLETTPEGRREMFRKVKHIYKLRSTLAHGQKLEIDEEALNQVNEAALVLSRALLQMVTLSRTELDLVALDLD